MAYWLFQSISSKFDLPSALKEAPEHGHTLTFLVKQYAAKIKPGDIAFMWFGGKGDPGLYAMAKVQTHPADMESERWQEKYARVDFPLVARRVRLKIERLLEPPVVRRAVIEMPEMAFTTFVRNNAQGTNFPLRFGEARAIESLIAGRRR